LAAAELDAAGVAGVGVDAALLAAAPPDESPPTGWPL
jgi:hypothetical protein